MNERIDTSPVVSQQYDKALDFLNLLQSKEDLANLAIVDFWNAFHNKVFDIDTCDGFGLSMWSGLLGVKRPMMASGRELPDDAFRRVLKAKFWLYDKDATIPTITEYLSKLFDCGEGSTHPDHKAVVIDGGLSEDPDEHMTIEYQFWWNLNEEESAILEIEGVLPHPTGVLEVGSGIGVVVDAVFGFNGFYVTYKEQLVPLALLAQDGLGYKVKIGEVDIEYIPPLPYYTYLDETAEVKVATRLRYDPNPVEIEEGVYSHFYYINPDGEHERIYVPVGKIYDSPNYDSKHELHVVNSGVLYYMDRFMKKVVVPDDSLADVAKTEDGILVKDTEDYLSSGIESVAAYIRDRGQSLNNFNNGHFFELQENR